MHNGLTVKGRVICNTAVTLKGYFYREGSDVDNVITHRRMAVPIDGGSVDSFYVQLAGKILGPCKTIELRKLPGFVLQTLVRPVGSDEWFPAFSVINLKSLHESKRSTAGHPYRCANF